MKLTLQEVKNGLDGSFCIRCGEDRKAIRRHNFACAVYGTSYKTHMFKVPKFELPRGKKTLKEN